MHLLSSKDFDKWLINVSLDWQSQLCLFSFSKYKKHQIEGEKINNNDI